jgi:hypothetical protein
MNHEEFNFFEKFENGRLTYEIYIFCVPDWGHQIFIFQNCSIDIYDSDNYS